MIESNVRKMRNSSLRDDVNAVVSEAEKMMRSVAEEGGEKANALRAKMEESLYRAKQGLRDMEDAVVERTRATARATDEYIHENPWQTVAAAAGLSLIVGAVIGILLSRR